MKFRIDERLLFLLSVCVFCSLHPQQRTRPPSLWRPPEPGARSPRARSLRGSSPRARSLRGSSPRARSLRARSPRARSLRASSLRAPPPPTSRPAGPRSRCPPQTSRRNPRPSPPASSPLMSQVSAVTDVIILFPKLCNYLHLSIAMYCFTKPLRRLYPIMDR